jgi:hypothetical protein
VAWAGFLKEMEEVWLQSRPRTERERRVLDEVQRIQGEIWQTLKIAEWQKAYNDAKTALPSKARALLDPFEELSSRVLLSRRDLNAFLKKWGDLQAKIQTLHRCWMRGEESAARWLDQPYALQRDAWQSAKVREWQDAYSRFKGRLPSRLDLLYARFDALSNRIVCSRQDLIVCWARTRGHLSEMRIWHIPLSTLAVACFKELFLATAFARSLFASIRRKDKSGTTAST